MTPNTAAPAEGVDELVAEVFSESQRVSAMLRFEAALAKALGDATIISHEHASTVASGCDIGRIDMARLARDAAAAGNDAIPLIEQLRELVTSVDPEAATYVHWGATSQDAIDTSLVLQLGAALELYESTLSRLIEGLADLADRYAASPMIGRTWLQHGVPTTFGLKVATWLDAVLRHRTRLTSLHQTTRVLQFGGAVGTLGALGAAGPRVAASLASELGLRLPEVSWHTSRDRIAEVATVIALLIGTLGKMARDISLMAQSEVDEVREASASKRGRSSTMPQKRNPVGCARVLAASVRVPQLAATMLAAMSQEHERGLGGWQAEWETVPAICTVGYDALTQMADVIAGLEVDERRMAENLAVTRGLAFAEAVSFALMPRMGRAAVEQVLGRAMVEVRNAKGGVHLRDALARDPKVAAHLSAEELDRLFDARAQLETATVMARAVVARARETLS